MKMIKITVSIATEKDEVTKMWKRQVPWMGDMNRKSLHWPEWL